MASDASSNPGARAKDAAASRAADLVRDGAVLGLGTGSTADAFLDRLGERIAAGLTVRGIPTSEGTARRAREIGIPLIELGEAVPDLVVDGADEIDPRGRLIKGGGGALVREKLVARAGGEMVVLAHWEKLVPALGAFPLPVAVLPFSWRMSAAAIEGLGAQPRLRVDSAGNPTRTDDGLFVLDCPFGTIEDPESLETRIEALDGVVACGLFNGLADRLVIGLEEGGVEEREVVS